MNPSDIQCDLELLLINIGSALPSDEIADMLNMTRAGEPGVALENLCEQIVEYEITVDAAVLEKIILLANQMGFDPSYWRDINVPDA